jgi:hypothetical protein
LTMARFVKTPNHSTRRESGAVSRKSQGCPIEEFTNLRLALESASDRIRC